MADLTQARSADIIAATTASVTMTPAPAEGAMLTATVSLGNTSGGFTVANGYALVATASAQAALLWKIAGAGEPAAQVPCTWVTPRDGIAGITEHAPGDATASHDVSAFAADATSPQDLAAINPTDGIDTVMVGATTNDVARTSSAQTIGAVAATERLDVKRAAGNESLAMFDRLDVPTSTSTFAAQSTASGVPTNGMIGLVIYKLTPTLTRARRTLLGVGV